MRATHAKGELSDSDYESSLKKQTEVAIRWQEEIGLDVLVHGEFERNDMVQYFGEQLSGFAFTRHAWVQSYGSRYVRPLIIFGDVSRPNPMAVRHACRDAFRASNLLSRIIPVIDETLAAGGLEKPDNPDYAIGPAFADAPQSGDEGTRG